MTGDSCLLWGFIAIILVGALGLTLYLGFNFSLLAAYLVAVNVGVLLLYRYDKLISGREGAQRIPNELMAVLAFLGPLGAAFGIYLEVFPRETHKTAPKYWYLRLIVVFSLVLHLALLACYLLFGAEAMLEWARGLLASP
jgi:uncharacterized membrane protein YsdA (DUF1294 family)